jgi:hypothetical protein
MNNLRKRFVLSASVIAMVLTATMGCAQTARKFTPQDGDYVLRDFHFKSGETLPELRMHYMTMGKPERDANGRVTKLFFLTTLATGNRASLATACTRIFRNTTMTTWCWRNTIC